MFQFNGGSRCAVFLHSRAAEGLSPPAEVQNPAGTCGCAFACAGADGRHPSLPGREERERESRDPLRIAMMRRLHAWQSATWTQFIWGVGISSRRFGAFFVHRRACPVWGIQLGAYISHTLLCSSSFVSGHRQSPTVQLQTECCASPLGGFEVYGHRTSRVRFPFSSASLLNGLVQDHCWRQENSEIAVPAFRPKSKLQHEFRGGGGESWEQGSSSTAATTATIKLHLLFSPLFVSPAYWCCIGIEVAAISSWSFSTTLQSWHSQPPKPKGFRV